MIKLLDEFAALIGAIWTLCTWKMHLDPDVETVLLGAIAVLLFCVWYGKVAYAVTFGV